MAYLHLSGRVCLPFDRCALCVFRRFEDRDYCSRTPKRPVMYSI